MICFSFIASCNAVIMTISVYGTRVLQCKEWPFVIKEWISHNWNHVNRLTSKTHWYCCKINVKNSDTKLLIKINENMCLREWANTEFVWQFKQGFVKVIVGRAVRSESACWGRFHWVGSYIWSHISLSDCFTESQLWAFIYCTCICRT